MASSEPSQPSNPVAPPLSAGTSGSVTTARPARSPTTPAVTDTVRSARAWTKSGGCRSVVQSSCPCPTSIWSSPCPSLYGLGLGLFRAGSTTTVSLRLGDSSGGRRQSQAPRRPHRGAGRTPYLEPEADPASSPALHRAGRRSVDPRSLLGAEPKAVLLTVRILSRLFRGKFLAALKAAYQAGEFKLQGSLAPYQDPKAFTALLATLYAKPWVVYSKPPSAAPNKSSSTWHAILTGRFDDPAPPAP